jgi:hypothetical protein
LATALKKVFLNPSIFCQNKKVLKNDLASQSIKVAVFNLTRFGQKSVEKIFGQKKCLFSHKEKDWQTEKNILKNI